MANAWRTNHPWATVYDFLVESERVGHPLARLGAGTDFGLLWKAAEVIGELPAGSAVLDVPCGGGVALRGLRPGQGVRYVAADISDAMLERTRVAARERGLLDQLELVNADVASLPFDDATFDLVVSFTGLHCFPDVRGALAEIARVTRPGGRLSGSAVLTDAGLRHEPMRFAGRLMGLMGPGCSSTELQTWLVQDGFEAVALRRSGGITYFTARKT
ncbi:class I SAM-dependent methyltransferase [Paraconexibacter sp.]|uniref:class I SAM-dependent methyltransferase n=1 Tax=Paraconexibacter sp. TaxID=2949640 RepID=UPI0035627F72